MQRANVLVKQGLFNEAKEDYQLILKSEPNNNEAIQRIESIINLSNDLNRARLAIQNRDYNQAIDLLTRILEVRFIIHSQIMSFK